MIYRQDKWEVTRSEVASGSADSALSATTSKYATILTNHQVNWFTVPPIHNRVAIRFRHSANNNNCTFTIYGMRTEDDAFTVGSGKAYAGTQQASEQISSATTYHCDKINIVTDGAEYWITPLLSTCEDDTADNKRAVLILRACEYKHFLVLVTAVSAGSVAVDMVSYRED